MRIETLKLFDSVPVGEKGKFDIPEDIHARTFKHGYVLDGSFPPDPDILEDIEEVIGISGEKANASFHKSWSVVKDTPMEILVIQQIMHYMTTYGFENLGIYDERLVYVPLESLELPEVTSIPLTVVKGITNAELRDKIVDLGSSGIALHKETLKAIMTIVEESKWDSTITLGIKNRELNARLYDLFDLAPKEPEEYLRYLISKLTNESLLIKNTALIDKIKASSGKFLDTLLKYAPEDLASIFLRYKPLFLAMKKISKNKRFFNQLRREAKTKHRPLPEDYLNSVTSQVKKSTLDIKKLASKLDKATVWRKIRLASALNYRLNETNSIVYTVRHGRGWATEFDWPVDKLGTATKEALQATLESIAGGMTDVKDKMFYIPKNVKYALPATEKQFVGQIPSGSYISAPEDLVFGIHWTNLENYRVDLDLSLISVEGKIGWDGDIGYRSRDRDIMFSGDLTDAPRPNGASELFYVKEATATPQLLTVNYYNYASEHPVECKVIVTQDKVTSFSKKYMLDANNIVGSANFTIDKKQNVIGLVVGVDGENRFYFTNVSIGRSITARANDHITHARKFLLNRTLKNTSFNEVLTMAGAKIVEEKPEEDEFVDLSPEVLEKGTLIDILKQQ